MARTGLMLSGRRLAGSGQQQLPRRLRSLTSISLRRFQLYGLACLRVALEHSNHRHQAADLPKQQKELDPRRFAHISDRAYSSDEVVKVTEQVQLAIPVYLRQAPSAKIFLRSFWYRLAAAQRIDSSKMHVYTLAR